MSLIDTIQSLLPELSNTASTEAIFGRPVAAGGAVVIPVARLVMSFAGLGGSSQAGFGGGVRLEPVAVIVVKDGEVSLLRLGSGFSRRRPRILEVPVLDGASPDGEPRLDLVALVDAIRTLIREITVSATGARPSARGRTTPGGAPRRAPRKPLGVPEKAVEQERPHDVADRGHGESQRET